MNIELYIAQKLCDLEKSDLSIKLKRQFINPSELNVKDSQKSYTISLPSTPTNDAIFRYSNVEETERKFSLYPDAQLYVNGILIMEGKFRLTGITRNGYKGNLGVPAPLTAKDIFKEMKMNEIGEWKLHDDENITWKRQTTISELNVMENPPIMFPMVMHKLFNRDKLPYGGKRKDVLDKDVCLRLQDMPPSLNCMGVLRKIFSNSKYTLTGSAMNDERLNALYMSYKNPNDYKTDWDVQNPLRIEGNWAVYHNDDFENNAVMTFEDSNNGPEKAKNERFVSNIFEGTNHRIIEEAVEDKDGWIGKTEGGVQIVIPRSGLYKVNFDLSINYGQNPIDDFAYKYDPSGIYAIKSDLKNPEQKRVSREEIILVKKKSDTKLNTYNFVFDEDKGVTEGATYFVDDKDFICGFSFGKWARPLKSNPCNPMVTKGSAVHSPQGYAEGNRITFRENRPDTIITNPNNYKNLTFVNGHINQLIWLEKGEILGLIGIGQMSGTTMSRHNLTYRLRISPFQKDPKWLTDQLNSSTNTGSDIDWYEKENYYTEELNLTQFLPSETTVNDWIDNFCKALNLKLTHVGDKNFSLDVKETKLEKKTSKIIDLDQKANVRQGQNEPLNLPMEYQLGFTVNNSEEGYYLTSEKEKDEEGKETKKAIANTGGNGGGKWKTHSQNTNVTKQNSNFSYCWYKDISGIEQPIPVITEREVWVNEASDYKEKMDKTYYNLPQRFWFKDGTKTVEANVAGANTMLALVSNNYRGAKPLQLDYKDEPNSIMQNYFMLLINELNFTTIECYLSPEEYIDLGNAYVKLNGDLYIVAEADGYDPMGRSTTKLKLIKKM